MKIALIIPLYNQSKNWHRIVLGIQKQSIKPDNLYIVVDRPSDDIGATDGSGRAIDGNWNAISEISKLNSQFININVRLIVNDTIPAHVRSSDSPTFLAGYARNIGIESAVSDGCDVFVFSDGDCVPQSDFIKSHVGICDTSLPVLSIGRRREAKYRWMDQREITSNLVHLKLFEKNGCLVNNPDLLKQCLIVWSCNMALNKSAINILYKFNEQYYSTKCIFNSIFDGVWGGEDSFLGISAWYCRIFINTIGNTKSGVEHIDHPRPDNIYTIKHKEYFESQCELLRRKVAMNPINMKLLDYTH